jgi:hypothetical protein
MDLRLSRDDLKYLFLSFAFSSVSIFFAYYIYPSATSILSISFIVIALTPSFFSLIENEEALVAHCGRTLPFLDRYEPLIILILVLSVGVFLSLSLWYNVLPSDPSYHEMGVCSTSTPCREGVFKLQIASIEELRGVHTGLGLMLFAFVLSLFFGTGALLIIVWDVSTLVVASAVVSPINFLLHLPKLLAFFLTGLSGALLSVAIVRHEWCSHSFTKVFKDSLRLLLLAMAIYLLTYFLFRVT